MIRISDHKKTYYCFVGLKDYLDSGQQSLFFILFVSVDSLPRPSVFISQSELKLMDNFYLTFHAHISHFYCIIAGKGYLYATKSVNKDIHSHFSFCVFPILKVTWTHFTETNTCQYLLLLWIFCLFLHIAHLPLIMFDTFETESLGFFFLKV